MVAHRLIVIGCLIEVMSAAPVLSSEPSSHQGGCEATVGGGGIGVIPVHILNRSTMGDSDIARMTTLVDAIWARYAIRFDWHAQSAGADGLVVILAASVAPDMRRAGVIPLASIVFDADHATSRIYVWRDNAVSLLAAGRRNHDVSAAPMTIERVMIPRVLGVALAHEIGHYLLDTRTHASSGLLRAAIPAAELFEPLLAQLGLGREQASLLCRMRALPLPPDSATAMAER